MNEKTFMSEKAEKEKQDRKRVLTLALVIVVALIFFALLVVLGPK